MKIFFKKPIIIGAAAVLFGALVVRAATNTDTNTANESVVVETRTVTAEITTTGRVEPAERVDLGFETTGKIVQVYASVGKMVKSGELLVALRSGELTADFGEAEANLLAEQAKFDELTRGKRPEEIHLYELKVSNQRADFVHAEAHLADVIIDTRRVADDAIHNKTDQIFFNPTSQNPEVRIPGISFALENDLETERTPLESLLYDWETEDIGIVKQQLDRVRRFLDNAALAVNNPTYTYQSAGISEPIPDAWKASIATARANVNTAITDVSSAEEELQNARSALALAEQELTLAEAGTAAEQVTVQEARIDAAQAAIARIQSQLAKTVIRSPMTGIVVVQDAAAGEIVSAHTPIVSVISASAFEITANVPEVDIAKLALGDTARVTLDAYSDEDIFHAVISRIDPAETLVDGVTTYKVMLRFSDTDDRIKSGMTANVRITTGTREQVVAVPAHAIRRLDDQEIVRVLRNGVQSDAVVETGLIGSDGYVEIVSGVSAGDRIITNN